MWQKIKEWFYQTPELESEEEVALSCIGVLVPFHRLVWTKHCSVIGICSYVLGRAAHGGAGAGALSWGV